MIDKREEENIEFEVFLNAIKTIMLFDNYFEEMEVLFKYLDQKKLGTIKKTDLTEAIRKLRENIAKNNNTDSKNKCDLRVPNEEDLEDVYSSMTVDEEGYLNYDEYLIALFRVTQNGD